MESLAIAVTNVSKSYLTPTYKKFQALQDVSLSIKRGEVFGFLGPNGAGKTSLIKIIVGLMSPSKGTASVAGHPSLSSKAKLKLGYLPENPYFHTFLTGEEFLKFHGKLLGLDTKTLESRIPKLLKKLDLQKAGDVQLKKYSKGMLTRVGFAQALLHDPEVLILDEPMTGLDPVGRREVRDIINEIAISGKTVFFSTHILYDVEVICTTVGFIKEGVLQGAGSIDSLLGKTIKSVELRFNLPFGKEASFETARKTMDGWVLDIEAKPEALEELANDAIAKITREKGTIRSVIPRKNTLEDLFFKK